MRHTVVAIMTALCVFCFGLGVMNASIDHDGKSALVAFVGAALEAGLSVWVGMVVARNGEE